MTFGSNLTHFKPPAAPTGDVHQQGWVYTYRENRDLAKQLIAQMIGSGLTDFRIPIVCVATEELGALTDGFTCALDAGSNLDYQRSLNLITMLGDLKNAGARYVALGPGAEGNLLSPYNWPDVGTRWERMANFIWSLRTLLDSFGFADAVVDFGELVDPSKPVVLSYAQTLWAWYTTAAGGPPDNRVTDAMIGVTPMPANIAALPGVFNGGNPGGPVNWPRTRDGKIRLGVHVYGGTPAPRWGSAYDALAGTEASLQSIVDPSQCALEISETYDFGDVDECMELQRAWSDNPQWNVTRVLQWPLRPGVPDFGTSPCVRGWPL